MSLHCCQSRHRAYLCSQKSMQHFLQFQFAFSQNASHFSSYFLNIYFFVEYHPVIFDRVDSFDDTSNQIRRFHRADFTYNKLSADAYYFPCQILRLLIIQYFPFFLSLQYVKEIHKRKICLIYQYLRLQMSQTISFQFVGKI